ncbi:alanine--tRNA ligase-related protein, partial [Neisseria sp. P0018.S003]|uniref:alanine--tRNA ligase-related protein n=1 Tax=Neisseria sp. P0018.S003 TaxID=3436789 RepID=UPI003F7DD013
MEAQRTRARAAQSFKANAPLHYEGQDTEFQGYSARQTESKVLALYKAGEQVNELNEGDDGAIVIDFTPFYAESGGRVGDVGYIFEGENRSEVHDTQKIKAAVFGQFGVHTSGRMKVGDSVTAKVDADIRPANMRKQRAKNVMHK